MRMRKISGRKELRIFWRKVRNSVGSLSALSIPQNPNPTPNQRKYTVRFLNDDHL